MTDDPHEALTVTLAIPTPARHETAIRRDRWMPARVAAVLATATAIVAAAWPQIMDVAAYTAVYR